VLRDRMLSAIHRPARSAALLAMVVLAALPAAAQARNYKIDGVVTGPPAVRGGAVTVPIKVTPRVGRALNFGTRNVGVRLARRARLRLSGTGASGASRLQPSALRAGDRVKGVTSLTRRARRRLRWHFRPTLPLKRATVIRRAPRAPAPQRALGAPGTIALPPFSGLPSTPLGQIAAHLAAQASALAARSDEAGPLAQKIDAQKPQLEELKNGIKGVTDALELLHAALVTLQGQGAPVDALITEVDAITARVEALEVGISPIDSAVGELGGALDKVSGAAEKLTPVAGNIAAQVATIQQTAGAQAAVTSLDAGATAMNGRLDTLEAGLSSIDNDTKALIGAMTQLAGIITTLAGSSDIPTLTAGVNGLDPAVDSLESGFGRLAATSNTLLPVADAIEIEAPELEKAASELCSLVPTTCP
jgi:hypothetical protein